jgi:hypothetical protein
MTQGRAAKVLQNLEARPNLLGFALGLPLN